MMSKLLKKEFALAMHPTVPIMILLAAMVLIPSYPYSVSFFYVGLALFFTCLLGRENHDIQYSMLLPVAKKQIVHARIAFAVIIELIQLAVMAPLTLLSRRLTPVGNLAGLDASPALIGWGLVIFGVFNLVFFTVYYRDVSKVGRSFLLASVGMFLLIIVEVSATYALPFVRDRLDTTQTAALPLQFAVAGMGAVVFVLLTLLACRRSVTLFQRQDLA